MHISLIAAKNLIGRNIRSHRDEGRWNVGIAVMHRHSCISPSSHGPVREISSHGDAIRKLLCFLRITGPTENGVYHEVQDGCSRSIHDRRDKRPASRYVLSASGWRWIPDSPMMHSNAM